MLHKNHKTHMKHREFLVLPVVLAFSGTSMVTLLSLRSSKSLISAYKGEVIVVLVRIVVLIKNSTIIQLLVLNYIKV